MMDFLETDVSILHAPASALPPWPDEEVRKLIELSAAGLSDDAIGAKIGRSRNAVKHKRWSLLITKPKNIQKAKPRLPRRCCKVCKTRLKLRDGEKVSNFKRRMTCSTKCEAINRGMTRDDTVNHRDGWPEIDRFFVWPEGARFEDSEKAIGANLGTLRMLPPPTLLNGGNAARMMVEGEGGSTGRRR